MGRHVELYYKEKRGILMNKLKTTLLALVLIMLMASLGTASKSHLDFKGVGSLLVHFVGYNVDSVSINSTTGSDLIREDSVQAQGDFVFLWEGTNPSTVDRFVIVDHGSAEFDQTYPGICSYGASVESNDGIGDLWSSRISSTTDDTNLAFLAGVLANLDYTISLYASSEDPLTSVQMNESNEDAVVLSQMFVSWSPNGLFSDPVELEFNMKDENWGGSMYVTLGYRFCAAILSAWNKPAIAPEMMVYLTNQVILMFNELRNRAR